MSQTVVLHVGGLHWPTSERGIEAALGRQAGVQDVEANAANQSATVSYDPDVTSVEELAAWMRKCGYHCAGRSVPIHVCDPLGSTHQAGAVSQQHPVDHRVQVERAEHVVPSTAPQPRHRRSSTRPTR